ncbi:MAG: GNAT family N-acetyltransferase [Actinomycetota bacterium]|nr:GNAT family N-acetyltransferase [Actinomycetota bacterium]
MTGVTVRRAGRGDAAAIAGVHVRSWQAAYRGLLEDETLDAMSVERREQSWGELLGEGDGPSFTLVADLAGRVAGFCSVATPSRDVDAAEGTAEVAAIYVEPQLWRRGVGSALLAAAVDDLHREGWRDATLWVFAENTDARTFYARFGFELDGSQARHETRGPAAVRLRAALRR